jgi:hypothetical protein
MRVSVADQRRFVPLGNGKAREPYGIPPRRDPPWRCFGLFLRHTNATPTAPPSARPPARQSDRGRRDKKMTKHNQTTTHNNPSFWRGCRSPAWTVQRCFEKQCVDVSVRPRMPDDPLCGTYQVPILFFLFCPSTQRPPNRFRFPDSRARERARWRPLVAWGSFSFADDRVEHPPGASTREGVAYASSYYEGTARGPLECLRHPKQTTPTLRELPAPAQMNYSLKPPRQRRLCLEVFHLAALHNSL